MKKCLANPAALSAFRFFGIFFLFSTITFSQERPVSSESIKTTKVQIHAILEQLRLSLTRQRTIQYTATYDLDRSGLKLDRGPKIVKNVYEYISDGNNFYVSTTGRDNKKETSPAIEAFNGIKYQHLRKARIFLSKALPPDRTPGSVQPIVVPFIFASCRRPSMDYNSLLDRALWDEIAEISTLQINEKLGNRSCAILTFKPQRNEKDVYTIYLDPSINYYPFKIVLDSPSSDMHYESFVTTSKVDTDLGEVIVPVKIRTETTKRSNVTQKNVLMSEDYAITPNTLKVNTPVSPDSFSINESRATAGIYDRDTKTFIKTPLTSDDYTDLATAARPSMLRYFVLFNIIVVPLVLILSIYWSNRSRSRSRPPEN